MPVTGIDGNGGKTPTVRELIEILKAIPEQFQDLPVGRYVDDGVSGIDYLLYWQREAGSIDDGWTAHVQLW